MKIQAKFMAIVLVAATLQVPIENAAHASTTSDLLDGSWTIEASDSQANVTWDLPSNSAEVKLYHEGELVASDFGSGFLNIPEVTPLEVLEFEIKVETPLAKSKAIQIANETGQSVDLVRSSYVRISGSNMTLRVPAAGTASISSADAVTTLPDYTIIRYQTFIPNYSVNAPLPVCAPVDGHNYRFLGDNRGFDATASSYRTRFDVRVNWINNTAISPTRTVGITTRQKQDPVTKVWEFDGTAVASNDKMDLTLQGTQTSNHATFNIRQDVTNPYCIFPTSGIFADFDISVWRASSYSYDGHFLRAPNHEMYLKDQDKTVWDVLLMETTRSMDCLNYFVWINTPEICSANRYSVGTR